MFIGILSLTGAAVLIVLLVFPPGPLHSSRDRFTTWVLVLVVLVLLGAGGGCLYEAGQKKGEQIGRSTTAPVVPVK